MMKRHDSSIALAYRTKTIWVATCLPSKNQVPITCRLGSCENPTIKHHKQPKYQQLNVTAHEHIRGPSHLLNGTEFPFRCSRPSYDAYLGHHIHSARCLYPAGKAPPTPPSGHQSGVSSVTSIFSKRTFPVLLRRRNGSRRCFRMLR